MVQRKKFIGMKCRFYTYQSHLHCIGYPKEKSRKTVAAQSETGYFAGLQLKLQFVCDKGDELTIGRLSIGIADRVSEEPLEGIQIASVPCNFNSMADGPFHPAGGGLEYFRYETL